MCLMFEKRTAHAKSNEAGRSTVHPFQGDAAPLGGVGTELERASTSTNTNGGVFGATSTTEDVLSGVNLRGKQILVPVFRRDWAWLGRAHSPRMAHMLSARRDFKKAEAATAQLLQLCGLSRRTL